MTCRNSIATQLWHNYVIITTPYASWSTNIYSTIYINKRKTKEGFTFYYIVIAQNQPEIYMFGISGKGNFPVSTF